jgi:hypothetical protein
MQHAAYSSYAVDADKFAPGDTHRLPRLMLRRHATVGDVPPPPPPGRHHMSLEQAGPSYASTLVQPGNEDV